ncbi:MAG: hypothetical protein FWD36_05485 [Treponema sp.]|nr:hypothetical protein [Treponema sp.]
MKSKTLLATLTTIVVLAACPADTNTGAVDGSMAILILSDQVYTRSTNTDNIFSSIITYDQYNNDLDISDGGLGGTGNIRNGRINYIIENPADAALIPLNVDNAQLAALNGFYSNFNISRNDAHIALLYLVTTDSIDYTILTRENIKSILNIFSMSLEITSETVSYIYIDKDTAITAQGSQSTYPLTDIPIDDFLTDYMFNVTAETIDLTAQDINLGLKKGWNPVRTTLTIKLRLNVSNIEIDSISGDIRISLGDSSSHKWTLNTL